MKPLERWLKFYILDENRRVIDVEPTSKAFYDFWINPDNRVVKQEVISEAPHILVSTVFTSSDASLGFGRSPECFETMVFWIDNKDMHNWSDRYATWDEAVVGHMVVVNMVKQMIEPQT